MMAKQSWPHSKRCSKKPQESSFADHIFERAISKSELGLAMGGSRRENYSTTTEMISTGCTEHPGVNPCSPSLLLDLIDVIRPFNHSTKHRISHTILSFALIQKSIVRGVDEELASRAVRNVRSRHRYRILLVLKPLVDSFLIGLRVSSLSCCIHSATLNHESLMTRWKIVPL